MLFLSVASVKHVSFLNSKYLCFVISKVSVIHVNTKPTGIRLYMWNN